jgi:hypothetical protein
MQDHDMRENLAEEIVRNTYNLLSLKLYDGARELGTVMQKESSMFCFAKAACSSEFPHNGLHKRDTKMEQMVSLI